MAKIELKKDNRIRKIDPIDDYELLYYELAAEKKWVDVFYMDEKFWVSMETAAAILKCPEESLSLLICNNCDSKKALKSFSCIKQLVSTNVRKSAPVTSLMTPSPAYPESSFS